jgi:hypothetical protein
MQDVDYIEGETVCLIACTSRKGLYPAAAQFIYRSPLFAAGRSYAESRADKWFILSAKHGLLSPSDEIAPYDESLHNLNDAARKRWAHEVNDQLKSRMAAKSRVIFLAGAAYRFHLERLLRAQGHLTAAPMSSLGIGSQVAWLQKVARNEVRLRDIDRFYALLRRLSAASTEVPTSLRNHTAKSIRPQKGVYFFFEQGELRMTSPFEERVTRIGTHSVSAGSKATLWGRLRTHRGGVDGSGNHRGSIFRLHVGECVIAKSELEAIFPMWGKGQSASSEIRAGEQEIEAEVSDVIGAMRVLWLEVADAASPDSDRAYLERNLIALVAGSHGPIDLPSAVWLGHWSSRHAIRSSGLWNVNHVREDYDPNALNVLEEYVERTESCRPPDGKSRAPRGWRLCANEARSGAEQIELI